MKRPLAHPLASHVRGLCMMMLHQTVRVLLEEFKEFVDLRREK